MPQTPTTTLITGNTYPVKDRLRALGGRWNRAAQGWGKPMMARIVSVLVGGWLIVKIGQSVAHLYTFIFNKIGGI